MVVIGKKYLTYDEFFESYFHSWNELPGVGYITAKAFATEGRVVQTNLIVPRGAFSLSDDVKNIIKHLRRKLLPGFTQGAVVYEVERPDNIGHVVRFVSIPKHGIAVEVDMVISGRTDRVIYLPEQLKVL